MHPTYQQIPIADAEPGMALSDEILDAQGHVLLPQGALLTERSIAQLLARGVDVVAVLCPAPPAAPAPDAGQTVARIDHLFRKNDPDDADDWATGLLRRYMTDYRLDRELEQ